MNKIKNMNDTESKNLKFIILHINDTQVRLLEKFFEKIGIYYYTVENQKTNGGFYHIRPFRRGRLKP